MQIGASIIARLRVCHHQVQDVHTVFLSQPYFLIGSFVLDVGHVSSTATLIQNKLVPVLHHFGLLIPEPFSLWHPERSWIFAVGRQVCKSQIFLILHYTLCCHRLACENHWLPGPSDSVKGWFVSQSKGMTVSPAPESTTRGFGNAAQVLC